MAGRNGRKWAAARVLATVVVALIVAAVITAAVTACGGSSVAGTYKYGTGTQKQMAAFKLTLNDDKTFKLAGPNPLGGAELSIGGTYTLDGDKISLKDEKGTQSEVGTVDGDKLVFKDVTWVKE